MTVLKKLENGLHYFWVGMPPIQLFFNLKTKTLVSEENLCKIAYGELAYFIRLILDELFSSIWRERPFLLLNTKDSDLFVGLIFRFIRKAVD